MSNESLLDKGALAEDDRSSVASLARTIGIDAASGRSKR